jgi:ribosomal protein S12 methylthiotransferase
MESLVTSAKNLVKNGTKELILIAQDLTFYGLDIYKDRKLADLLKNLSDIEGLDWIRLQYAYPSGFPMDVLDVMNERDNICKYLDMPLQHASSNMLKAMRRGITREKTTELIHTIREKVPGIAMRTTLITGYPGETVDDFNQMQEWVQEMRFDRLGVFTYSHEENTHAYNVPDDVPQRTKTKRANAIMEIQSEISLELNEEKVGKEYKVLIDRAEGDHFIGRTEFDSPEVDNEVLIDKTATYVRIGDFVNVKINSAEHYDLFGSVVE